jgi:hypothetical protein
MQERRYSPHQIEVLEEDALSCYVFAASTLAGAVYSGISAVRSAASLSRGEGGLVKLALSTASTVGLGWLAMDNLRYGNALMREAGVVPLGLDLSSLPMHERET